MRSVENEVEKQAEEIQKQAKTIKELSEKLSEANLKLNDNFKVPEAQTKRGLSEVPASLRRGISYNMKERSTKVSTKAGSKTRFPRKLT